jgi:hypothetical protein
MSQDAMTFIRVFRRPGNYLPAPGLPAVDRLLVAFLVLCGAPVPRALTRRLGKR